MTPLQQAACRNVPPGQFYANKPWPALRICFDCPVRRACLEQADREEQGSLYIFGVRGGMTASQRRRRQRVTS